MTVMEKPPVIDLDWLLQPVPGENPAGTSLLYAGLHGEIMGESFRFKNGYVLPPQTPGLGIQLTEAIKSRYPFVPGTGEFNSVPGKRLTT